VALFIKDAKSVEVY